ncbi:MAG: CCA tRNA nucleotidyltransferase [Acetilactobacillus jinshanensis]
MRLTNLPVEFKKARPVLQRVERAGYQAYFVGGSVRDTIIGVPIHDVDITSSAYPQEIKKLFPRTVDTGIKHGTVMVLYHGNGYEITTFRTESGYQDYRRPDHVTFVRSLPKDLKRRDFTINALAMRENGEVTDLFDGLGDIKRKVIKAVGDPNRRFHEDALRMMRAVRFASKLDFRIEPKTLAAIKKYSFLLTKIAVERVHSEFVKMMMGMKPRMGLNYMIETNLYRYVPGFKNHLDALKRISAIPNLTLSNEAQVWSLISYEFGLNRHQINRLLKKWKSADKIIDDTVIITRTLSAIHDRKLTPFLIYQAGLLDFWMPIIWQLYWGLVINGGILIKQRVLAPGPKLGKVINQLELMVINRQIPNQDSALLTAAKKLSK